MNINQEIVKYIAYFLIYFLIGWIVEVSYVDIFSLRAFPNLKERKYVKAIWELNKKRDL
ncbi:hypothetical protein [Peptostreptococcus equinus]|uniref:Uncharacterized protein n=1 Tax=Peptostreptococcus equinus TaxID=3003601 RepID=A0ABY7JU41_9FIRM|nr:hypothetical protein [Peptostreptococcus sp. CBA3647]WAW15588.1 hypothetical protein O0R46_03850 [Peptostreptococcus sp. CBA3647]